MYFVEIEAAFMPWLMNETEKIVNKQLIARQLLDGNLFDHALNTVIRIIYSHSYFTGACKEEVRVSRTSY